VAANGLSTAPKLSPALNRYNRFHGGIALIVGSVHRPLSLVVVLGAATYFMVRRTLFLLSVSARRLRAKPFCPGLLVPQQVLCQVCSGRACSDPFRRDFVYRSGLLLHFQHNEPVATCNHYQMQETPPLGFLQPNYFIPKAITVSKRIMSRLTWKAT
jgi:hypothetical protein